MASGTWGGAEKSQFLMGKSPFLMGQVHHF